MTLAQDAAIVIDAVGALSPVGQAFMRVFVLAALSDGLAVKDVVIADVLPTDGTVSRRAAAEKQARYRARKRATGVTKTLPKTLPETVTRDVTPVTDSVTPLPEPVTLSHSLTLTQAPASDLLLPSSMPLSALLTDSKNPEGDPDGERAIAVTRDVTPVTDSVTPLPVTKKRKLGSRGYRCLLSTDADVETWLAKEKIPSLLSADGSEVASMLDYFGSTHTCRIGWVGTWRNWKRRSAERASSFVRTTKPIQRSSDWQAIEEAQRAERAERDAKETDIVPF